MLQIEDVHAVSPVGGQRPQHQRRDDRVTAVAAMFGDMAAGTLECAKNGSVTTKSILRSWTVHLKHMDAFREQTLREPQ